MKEFLTLIFVLAGASGFLLWPSKDQKWDGLKVTWGANPLSSSYFVSQPRTVKDAVDQGFVKISSCDTNAPWRGERYVKDNDYALILLYDVNGFIAGIQTSIPNNLPDGFPKANIKPPFVADGNRYTISAYFVDPNLICSTGRSQADYHTQGTGTNLYLQMTADPAASTLIPHQEPGISATKWTKGKCFYTMGQHYWYDLSVDMSCDDFYPTFLLYNNGELTAFGWALGTHLTSKKYEHPSPSTYFLFMETVPKCLYDQGTLSTMHIYLTSSVASDLC